MEQKIDVMIDEATVGGKNCRNRTAVKQGI